MLGSTIKMKSMFSLIYQIHSGDQKKMGAELVMHSDRVHYHYSMFLPLFKNSEDVFIYFYFSAKHALQPRYPRKELAYTQTLHIPAVHTQLVCTFISGTSNSPDYINGFIQLPTANASRSNHTQCNPILIRPPVVELAAVAVAKPPAATGFTVVCGVVAVGNGYPKFESPRSLTEFG